LIPAAPYKTILPRLAEAVGQLLGALGVAEVQVFAEVEAMRDAVVATTDDRRVLGSMNDFAWMTEAYVEDLSLHEAALIRRDGVELSAQPLCTERPIPTFSRCDVAPTATGAIASGVPSSGP
jgi:hypothetical protein